MRRPHARIPDLEKGLDDLVGVGVVAPRHAVVDLRAIDGEESHAGILIGRRPGGIEFEGTGASLTVQAPPVIVRIRAWLRSSRPDTSRLPHSPPRQHRRSS